MTPCAIISLCLPFVIVAGAYLLVRMHERQMDRIRSEM